MQNLHNISWHLPINLTNPFSTNNPIFGHFQLGQQQQQQQPRTTTSKILKPKTEITISDILSASLEQLLPDTYPSIHGLTPDVLQRFRNDPNAFDMWSHKLDLSSKERNPSHTTGTSTTTLHPPHQTTTWHSLPSEIRDKIYHHYFSTSTYTIHDPATCTCPECPSQTSKDIFWKTPKSLSTTIHSNQNNLFLTSPEIIHETHAIWLANSTFRFGACILRDPSRLYKIKTPVDRFTSIKKIQVTATDFNDTIAALSVFKQRLGLSDSAAPTFKVVFQGDKIRFRQLWHRMMNPEMRGLARGIAFLDPVMEAEIAETGLGGVKIEFTRDW